PAADVIDGFGGVGSRGKDAGRAGLVAASVDTADVFVEGGGLGSDGGAEQGRKADLVRSSRELVQERDGVFDGAGHVIVQVIVEPGGDPDAELGHGCADRGGIVGNGLVSGVYVQRVIAGDLLEDEGGVFDGA